MRKFLGILSGAVFGVAFVATCGTMKGGPVSSKGGSSSADFASLDNDASSTGDGPAAPANIGAGRVLVNCGNRQTFTYPMTPSSNLDFGHRVKTVYVRVN